MRTAEEMRAEIDHRKNQRKEEELRIIEELFLERNSKVLHLDYYLHDDTKEILQQLGYKLSEFTDYRIENWITKISCDDYK